MQRLEAESHSIVGNLAVRLHRVSKYYETPAGPVRAVDMLSLDIARNEFFTLLGPSGCGKTTLLRMIAGFEPASSGEIWLDGENVTPLPPNRRRVNTVFQNYALFPHLTVEDNIAFSLAMRRVPKPEQKARVREMLALVKLEGYGKRRPSQLSGGQQQRVALARALASRPTLLLLDEPLSALDLKLRKEMQVELKRLQKETGITFIFVTHDQEEAMTMSDRLAVLKDGQILQSGTPQEIYTSPNHPFVASFIGDINFLNARLMRIAPDESEWAFDGGGSLVLPASFAKGKEVGERIQLAIRPEHAALTPYRPGSRLQGRLQDRLYSGASTLDFIQLPDGTLFTVRRQNQWGETNRFTPGDAVSIDLPIEAIRRVGE